jgi:hypothetical protein
MYVLFTGLAMALAIAGLTAIRAPKAVPLRVRSRRTVRVVRRD